MIAISCSTLAQVVNGERIGEEQVIRDVVIDTRQVKPGCLFIALRGERFDGHDFATEAVEKGASVLLVNRFLPLDVAQIKVADTRLALGQLSHWVRQHSSARVVALTGSSGKTSVKELTAAILMQCGSVLYTEGNFNNDIGVPLTLLRLTEQHRYAVVELGANHQGEIAYTAQWVEPEAALVNNLSAAHLAGFGSLSGVAKAKGEIFTRLSPQGIAIINLNSQDRATWQVSLQDKQVWCFSSQAQSGSDFYATEVMPKEGGQTFTLHTPQGRIGVYLPLQGLHNIDNALAAAALAMSVGAPLSAVAAGLATAKSVPGRLFPIALEAGKTVIDDTYNANVGSMLAGIATLASQPGYRVLVVGDMAELGDEALQCHQQVGRAAAVIDKVLSVGTLSEQISLTSGKGEHFTDKRSLVEYLKQLVTTHSVITILVKGSRSAAMEQVVHDLQEAVQC